LARSNEIAILLLKPNQIVSAEDEKGLLRKRREGRRRDGEKKNHMSRSAQRSELEEE